MELDIAHKHTVLLTCDIRHTALSVGSKDPLSQVGCQTLPPRIKSRLLKALQIPSSQPFQHLFHVPCGEDGGGLFTHKHLLIRRRDTQSEPGSSALMFTSAHKYRVSQQREARQNGPGCSLKATIRKSQMKNIWQIHTDTQHDQTHTHTQTERTTNRVRVETVCLIVCLFACGTQ